MAEPERITVCKLGSCDGSQLVSVRWAKKRTPGSIKICQLFCCFATGQGARRTQGLLVIHGSELPDVLFQEVGSVAPVAKRPRVRNQAPLLWRQSAKTRIKHELVRGSGFYHPQTLFNGLLAKLLSA
jgi:hypothetical protein